jgi:hypothetical protein
MPFFKINDPRAPRLRVRGVSPPGSAPPGQRPMPVMVRNRLGGYPGANGGPGSEIWPYSENTAWGDGSTGGNSPPVDPPDIGGGPVSALTPEQRASISTPLGQSLRPWHNPCTYAGFPIASAAGVISTILTANDKRLSLLIQNNSSATAPDVAPTLYVGFNIQPGLNNGSLALPPGLGFFWGASELPPRDNILVVFLGGSGATQILAGSVIQGTYLDLSNSV